MPSGFVGLLKEHAKDVLKLEGAQADEFLRLLRELRDQIHGRLMSLGPSDSEFKAFQLRQVLAETETAVNAMERKAQGQYSKATEEAADLAIEHVGTELERLGRAFESEPTVVSIDAAQVLADPVQGLLADHFETSLRRYGLDLLNGVRQQLFIGMRSGDSYGSIVGKIAAEQGPFGRIGRAGGERLVRTETSQAYGVAQHTSLSEAKQQVPSLKKVWLHIGSWRCDVCMPLHGTMRDLDGTWTVRIGNKTKEVAHGPAHPNCVCRVSGMKPNWRSKMEKLGYLDQNPESAKSKPQEL